MFENVLKHRSGRVIALARSVLAAVFLLAIWADSTQPAKAVTETYALLAIYIVTAGAVAVGTWRNWWLDAKLAAPMHVLDIVVFTLLMFATDGYTSPFFLFFVFLVLSAAIRWGWRETAMTAAAVTLLYLGAGVLANGPDTHFELQRFIVRAGHLVILSALLIWFGINQGTSAMDLRRERFLPKLSLDSSPLETGLEAAMDVMEAGAGLLLWRETASTQLIVVRREGGLTSTRTDTARPLPPPDEPPFLFDLRKDRALSRRSGRRMRFFPARRAIDPPLAERYGLVDGLAIPLQTDTGSGLLLLSQADGLGIDHIELGQHLAAAVVAHIQRHALLAAVEESAVARARLSLSRDLHDSIVQFLAGATFRIEAITRSAKSGGEVVDDLGDLKQLFLGEQQELRSAIGAMRKDEVSLPDLARDLGQLCARLARQWNVGCTFSAEVPHDKAPMRLHLDAHQLVREAVANAVRHAGAQRIRVALSTEEENLVLEVANDGAAGDRLSEGAPWSLRERVDEANGTLMLASREGATTVSVTLPMGAGGPR